MAADQKIVTHLGACTSSFGTSLRGAKRAQAEDETSKKVPPRARKPNLFIVGLRVRTPPIWTFSPSSSSCPEA